jgi:ribosomal protein S18 acetylase RimI-like enzyme
VDFELIPFGKDMMADAASLLAGRHSRHRASFPELPARFGDGDVAWKALEAAWERPRASGMAALENGRLIGYLFGDVLVDDLMGRTAWVRLAGHALAPGVPADLYRDLYAAAAPFWLAYGSFAHYALMPAHDRASLEAFFALSFGQQQVYGLCALADVGRATPDGGRDLEIRRAIPGDREALADLSATTAGYQMGSPVWAPSPPGYLTELRAGYAELVDDEAIVVWLALREGRVLGFQGYFPAQAADDDMFTPSDSIELKIAGTRTEERGRGIGRALTRHGFAHARAQGYAYCVTDWRVTNLLSSRFWPRQGFRPVVYRLARRIDARIAWANPQSGAF